MPSTVLGLALFIGLLAPGFCFIAAREARLPERELSGLRETSLFLFVAVLCDVLALLALALVGAFHHSATPDVPALILDPSGYIASHLAFLGVWSLGLLVLACLIGWIFGMASVSLPQWYRKKFRNRNLGRIEFVSGWFKYLEESGKEAYCGCVLDDGSWVGGFLMWFSSELRETADRDIILTKPLYRRGPTDDDEVFVAHTDRVFISARRIVYMTASYLENGSAEAMLAEAEKSSSPETPVNGAA